MRLARDQWLYCLRVGLAVSLAYALAHGNDPTGGLYAVLGAALVQAVNVGEGLGISRDRILGTFLGVAIGIPVAILGGVSVWAVCLAVVAASVAGLLAGRTGVARIAITVAAVTVLVHAADASHYGIFRITNTAMGVAIAIAVSYAFWPVTGHQHLRRGIAQALRASAALARSLSTGSDLFERQRRLFFALGDLPKTLKEARQDPLRPDRTEALRASVVATVAIGASVLAASIAAADLAEDDGRASWHRDLGRAFAMLAERLDAEAAALVGPTAIGREKPILGRDALVRLQSGPFSSEPARLAVQGMVRDLQVADRNLAQLRPATAGAEVP